MDRIYLEKSTPHNLKGPAAYYFRQFSESGLNPEITGLVKFEGEWIRGEVMNLIAYSG